MRCAVFGCKNSKKSKYKKNKEETNEKSPENLHFHSFPKDELLCEKWINLCRLPKQKFKLKSSYICSIHFDKKDYKFNEYLDLYGIPGSKTLKNGSVPTKHLPENESTNTQSETESETEIKCEQIDAAYEIDPLMIKESEENQAQQVGQSNIDSESEIFLPKFRKYKKNLNDHLINTETETKQSTSNESIKNKSSQTDCKRTIEKTCQCNIKVDNKTVGTQFSFTSISFQKQEKQLQELSKDLIKLKRDAFKDETMKKSIETIFTAGQINKLKFPHKRAVWNTEDMENALSIHSAGHSAYTLLLQKGYPLPAVITLQKYCAKKKKKCADADKVDVITTENKELTK